MRYIVTVGLSKKVVEASCFIDAINIGRKWFRGYIGERTIKATKLFERAA